MAKNKIQYQKGFSLFDLHDQYGTEEQCVLALLNGCVAKFQFNLKTLMLRRDYATSFKN